MRYVAWREGPGIAVRAVKNNYVLKDGEAEADGALLPRPLSLYEREVLVPGDGHYERADPSVPDLSREYEMMQAESDDLAGRLEAAVDAAASRLVRQVGEEVNAAAARLRGRGVTHSRVRAAIKYEVLRQLDAGRRVNELASVRHEGLPGRKR